MIGEFTTLVKNATAPLGCSGPYLNVIPKTAVFPSSGYYILIDKSMQSKDVMTYGIAEIILSLQTEHTYINTDLGLTGADYIYHVAEQVKTALNGFLGADEDTIIEIRWSETSMDYNEEFEIHSIDLEFVVQHK